MRNEGTEFEDDERVRRVARVIIAAAVRPRPIAAAVRAMFNITNKKNAVPQITRHSNARTQSAMLQ